MRRTSLYYVVIAVLSLMGLWLLAGILQSRPPSAELARTAREAMDMARDAHDEAEAARRRSSAFRLVAMALGVAGPLVVVYLIYRLHARSESRPEDVFQVLEEQKLIDLGQGGRPRLPAADSQLLDESGQRQEDEAT